MGCDVGALWACGAFGVCCGVAVAAIVAVFSSTRESPRRKLEAHYERALCERATPLVALGLDVGEARTRAAAEMKRDAQAVLTEMDDTLPPLYPDEM